MGDGSEADELAEILIRSLKPNPVEVFFFVFFFAIVKIVKGFLFPTLKSEIF